MNNIDVVYTLWANLKKTPGMAVGQVGFHKQKEVNSTKHISCLLFNWIHLLFVLDCFVKFKEILNAGFLGTISLFSMDF